MNTVNMICATAALSLAFNCMADSKVTKPKNDATVGHIIIMESTPDKQCSITAVQGDYYFRDDTTNDCTNDQAYKVRFDNVPSALNVTFYNNGGTVYENGQYKVRCFDDSWVIEVRTIKNPTTTDKDRPIPITTMAAAGPGTIIAPGVLKISSKDDPKEGYNGKMSCVRVEDYR